MDRGYFARSAGEAQYDYLWRGLVAAYVPGLLPGGSVIQTIIPGSFNATLFPNSATGPQYTTWRGQRCLYFDGTDDYAQAVSAARMNSSPTFGGITISAWVAATDNQTRFSRILEKGEITNWALSWYSSTQGEVVGLQGGNFSLTAVSHLDGAWHHVAFTIRWYVEQRLFVDGTLFGPLAIANPSTLTTADLYFGRLGGGGYFGKHYLADALIYDRALTEPEIKLLYSLGPYGFATPRRRAWSVATTGGYTGNTIWNLGQATGTKWLVRP